MTSSFRQPRALTGLAVAAVLLLSACGGADDTAADAAAPAITEEAGDAVAPSPEGAAPTEGAGPLDFQATTVDGAAFDGAQLAGEPVAMWFWAPWCTICRAEAPEVAQVASEFEGKVTVLGVPGLGEVDAMKDFVSDTQTGGFDHVVDADGSLWSKFGVVAQPAFVFVDSEGNAETFAGAIGADQLRETLDALA